MITSEKSGVWELDDIYNKNKAGYLSYFEPAGLYYFGGEFGTQYSSPVQIPGTNWSVSGNKAAVKTNGTLWVWGDNGNGNLGQNDIVPRSSPTQIPGTQWVNGDASNSTLFATKTDGTLWMTGDYLGTAGWTSNLRSSPVQVPGTQWDFYKISKATSGHFHAVKTDGTLWSWGYSYYGTLGLNQQYTSNPFGPPSPQQVGSNTTWTDVKATWRGGIATKTDGTLWAWGAWGAPGTVISPFNTLVSYSSPVQIPGTSWNKFGGDVFNPVATKTDGTLWIWGTNYNGQLGLNQPIAATGISSPTQIPGTTWDQPIDNNNNQGGIGCWKTDGTLWVWGSNNNGRLGLNDNLPRSSPTQIPGTQWNKNNYSAFQLRISA